MLYLRSSGGKIGSDGFLGSIQQRDFSEYAFLCLRTFHTCTSSV